MGFIRVKVFVLFGLYVGPIWVLLGSHLGSFFLFLMLGFVFGFYAGFMWRLFGSYLGSMLGSIWFQCLVLCWFRCGPLLLYVVSIWNLFGLYVGSMFGFDLSVIWFLVGFYWVSMCVQFGLDWV